MIGIRCQYPPSSSSSGPPPGLAARPRPPPRHTLAASWLPGRPSRENRIFQHLLSLRREPRGPTANSSFSSWVLSSTPPIPPGLTQCGDQCQGKTEMCQCYNMGEDRGRDLKGPSVARPLDDVQGGQGGTEVEEWRLARNEVEEERQ
ncbi:unnamed protein product [Arctogadus glacialis]